MPSGLNPMPETKNRPVANDLVTFPAAMSQIFFTTVSCPRGGEPRAVGAKGHARDDRRNGCQALKLLTAFRIPELERLVERGRGENELTNGSGVLDPSALRRIEASTRKPNAENDSTDSDDPPPGVRCKGSSAFSRYPRASPPPPSLSRGGSGTVESRTFDHAPHREIVLVLPTTRPRARPRNAGCSTFERARGTRGQHTSHRSVTTQRSPALIPPHLCDAGLAESRPHAREYNLSSEDVMKALSEQSMTSSLGRLGRATGKTSQSKEYVSTHKRTRLLPESVGASGLQSPFHWSRAAITAFDTRQYCQESPSRRRSYSVKAFGGTDHEYPRVLRAECKPRHSRRRVRGQDKSEGSGTGSNQKSPGQAAA